MTIIADVLAGAHDAELDALERAVKDRKRAVGSAIKYTLKIGDKVRIESDTIHPRYLDGSEWIVERINSKTITAKPVDPTAVGRYKSGIRVPPDMIVKA